jgi:hypothetical protein
MKPFFEDLEVKYYQSETGITYAKYSLPKERSKEVVQPHVVLAIPGGRNSPRGDSRT